MYEVLIEMFIVLCWFFFVMFLFVYVNCWFVGKIRNIKDICYGVVSFFFLGLVRVVNVLDGILMCFRYC